MTEEITAIVVGKWALGIDTNTRHSIIQLEFPDRPPLILAWEEESVIALAKAIRAQYRKQPPKPKS